MAHFAKLGINGKVIQVVPFDDDRCKDSNDIEDEEIGRQALEAETGWPLWKQCSYNTHRGVHTTEGKTPLRANYPAIGDIYDEENDIFVIPKDSDTGSWTLNTTTGRYEPPVEMPDYADSMYNDGSVDIKYTLIWNESTRKWEGWSNDKSTKMAIWNGSSWDAV